jgi:hypothetical protein
MHLSGMYYMKEYSFGCWKDKRIRQVIICHFKDDELTGQMGKTGPQERGPTDYWQWGQLLHLAIAGPGEI